MLGVTREGNQIFPADALIRELIRGNSNTKCHDCRHIADACVKVKRGISGCGYKQVTWCSGYEQVAPNAGIQRRE